jgi:hypothetical protein
LGLSDVFGSGTLTDVVYVVVGVCGLLYVPRLLDSLHIGHHTRTRAAPERDGDSGGRNQARRGLVSFDQPTTSNWAIRPWSSWSSMWQWMTNLPV